MKESHKKNANNMIKSSLTFEYFMIPILYSNFMYSNIFGPIYISDSSLLRDSYSYLVQFLFLVLVFLNFLYFSK